MWIHFCDDSLFSVIYLCIHFLTVSIKYITECNMSAQTGIQSHRFKSAKNWTSSKEWTFIQMLYTWRLWYILAWVSTQQQYGKTEITVKLKEAKCDEIENTKTTLLEWLRQNGISIWQCKALFWHKINSFKNEHWDQTVKRMNQQISETCRALLKGKENIIMRPVLVCVEVQQWKQRRATWQWRATLLLCAIISNGQSSFPHLCKLLITHFHSYGGVDSLV